MSRWIPHWTHIVLHHSAGPDRAHLDTASIRRWHVEGRGWSDIGYHFLVERVEAIENWMNRDGAYEVIMGRPLHRWGAHCVANGMNGKAVGICLVGDYEREVPPVEQVHLTAVLVAGLLHALRLPAVNVGGHRDHGSTDCPGLVPVDVIRDAAWATVSPSVRSEIERIWR